MILLLTLLGSAGMAPAAANPSQTDPADRFARIDITNITPSVVSSGSGENVTVSGSVTNTSDRTVDDLIIRLQRGDRITEAAGLRTSLAADPAAFGQNTPFLEVTDALESGETAEFSISVPLSATDGLAIGQTGVFPLLVNINGTPEYGGPARIADSRTLLPVLSLPPDEDRATGYVDPALGGEESLLGRDGSVSADISAPSSLTMLWPLAAPPQLAPGVMGANTEPIRLVSEDLARSLSPDGRLHALVEALESISPANPGEADAPVEPDPGAVALRSGLCLAIDPDLLVTVRGMSLGYTVTTDPADPTAETRPGIGAEAAGAWLAALRQVAARSCVVALPFAQAGLDSLARIDDIGLSEAALTTPADVVDTILGVRSVRGAAIPAIGTLSAAGAGLLDGLDLHHTLLSATSVEPAEPDGEAAASGAYAIGELRLQTYQQPVSDALGALGDAPFTPALTPPEQTVDLSVESEISRQQAAVASLTFQALDRDPPNTPIAPPLPVTGRSQVIMPPTYWSPTASDASALLSTAGLLLDSGLSRVRPLTTLLDQLDGAGTPARLVEPPGVPTDIAEGLAVSGSAAEDIRQASATSWRFQSSLVSSDDAVGTPQRYVAPLREDLLRAIRTPDSAGDDTREQLAEQRSARIDAVEITLGRMREAVSLLDPGGRYTLASERSPLLLVVRNDLALPVRVRLEIDAPDGLEIGDTGVMEIPARGTRQLQLPTMADSSEALTVDIALVTSTGMEVGEAITLSVHSNAYGRALFVITIGAGAALVLLTARRLWRRFRGEPDPADIDRPEPDEHERLLAASTYQHRLEAQREYEAAERPAIGPEIEVDLSPPSTPDKSTPEESNPDKSTPEESDPDRSDPDSLELPGPDEPDESDESDEPDDPESKADHRP